MTSETIWRVQWEHGYGYPHCTHRETKTRRYDSWRAAARQIAAVLAMPGWHRLISVQVGTIDYEPDDNHWNTDDLPPVGCSSCGLVPAPPGPCPNNVMLPDGNIRTCGEKARFVAPTSHEENP